MKVTIETSARHIHISQEDLEILFGAEHQLTPAKDLSQPGQFAAEEALTIQTEKGVLENVRIIGPLRPRTQVEISRTDAYKLGINPPNRESGDLDGSAEATLIGPKGKVELTEGVIVALRHIHVTPDDAEKYDLKDQQMVSVKTGRERGLIFQRVLVRVSPNFAFYMHIDTDEANAAGISGPAEGEIIIE